MRCHVELVPDLIAQIVGDGEALPVEARHLPGVARSCAGEIHRHHALPRQDGGTSADHNLIGLCEKHHALIHRVMDIYGRVTAGEPRHRPRLFD